MKTRIAAVLVGFWLAGCGGPIEDPMMDPTMQPAVEGREEPMSYPGCKYSTCMNYCVPEHGFDWCHAKCNAECSPGEIE